MKKVKWGILGAASIALRKVIPGMQKGAYSEITAIASRDKNKAEQAARSLGIPNAYGSYEELLQNRNRSYLQSAGELFACAMVDQSSGGREACALREADQFDGGGGEVFVGGERSHRRENRRSVYGENAPAVVAHARACPQ